MPGLNDKDRLRLVYGMMQHPGWAEVESDLEARRLEQQEVALHGGGEEERAAARTLYDFLEGLLDEYRRIRESIEGASALRRGVMEGGSVGAAPEQAGVQSVTDLFE